MISRKEEEKQFRRNRILDAAEDLFLEKGWQVTTMDDVARRADFTKRSVYAYFPSKEDLWAALMTRGVQFLNQEYEHILDPGLSGLAQTRAMGQAFLNFSQKQKKTFRLLAHFSGVTPTHNPPGPFWTDLLKESQKNYAMLKEALDRGHRDGSVNPALRSDLTAFFLMISSTTLIKAAQDLPEGRTSTLGFSGKDLMEFGMDFMGNALSADWTHPSHRVGEEVQ